LPDPLPSPLLPYTTLFRSPLFRVALESSHIIAPVAMVCKETLIQNKKIFLEQNEGGPAARSCRGAGPHQNAIRRASSGTRTSGRSEEHTSELQSRFDLVCR